MSHEILDSTFAANTMPIRNNAQRAKTVLIVFYVLLGISVVSFISDYMEYNLLMEMQNGINFPSDEAINANDMRQGAIGLLYLVVYIAAVVVFIQWFRRAYYNLHQINVPYLEFTEGWAAGAWFVPFINLVRPYKIMQEIWQQTQDFIRKWDSSFHYRSGIVGWWWAAFLISNFVANIASRMTLRASDINDYVNASMANIISGMVSIPALVLAIILVKQTIPLEQRLREVVRTLSVEEEVASEDEATEGLVEG